MGINFTEIFWHQAISPINVGQIFKYNQLMGGFFRGEGVRNLSVDGMLFFSADGGRSEQSVGCDYHMYTLFFGRVGVGGGVGLGDVYSSFLTETWI